MTPVMTVKWLICQGVEMLQKMCSFFYRPFFQNVNIWGKIIWSQYIISSVADPTVLWVNKEVTKKFRWNIISYRARMVHL